MRHPNPVPAPVVRRILASLAAACLVLVAAASASAHGAAVPPEPSAVDLALRWSFDPTIQLPIVFAVVLWLLVVRGVDRAHPATPVPRHRTVAFLAALATLEVALQSGIERWDTTLFSVHMVQHVLLTMVAAPLVALAAPVTLALRAAPDDVRRGLLLPVLRSRVLRILAHPVVAWLMFAGVMWGSHFSPLFDVALEDPSVHRLEHVLYLGAALLFWWPAVAVDPAPHRMPHAGRVLYVFLQMPQNTFLSLAIFSATAPLYPHYATLGRTWGPTPLGDQQLAGGIMWLSGDVVFLVAVLALVLAWMRHEERATARLDARLDAERAAIRAREQALAMRHDRRVGEGDDAVPGAASLAGVQEVAPPPRSGIGSQSGMGAERNAR